MKDWCMSPHGIAGLQDQSSPNSGNKCRLARPLTPPNFVALRQEVCEIPADRKFLLPGNVDQRLEPKSLKTCYAPMPLCQSLTNMLHPSVFWRLRGTRRPKFTNLGRYQCAKPSNLSKWYLLPNFVDFVENVTDRPTKTVNDVSPHTMRRQKI